MKAEKKEINIQIGKRLQTARENSGYTQEVFCRDAGWGRALSQNRKWCLWLTAGENADLVVRSTGLSRLIRVTGDTNHKVDIELFLANCSREERDAFIDRMLAYMRKLMTGR